MSRFLDGFMYQPEAFLIHRVLTADVDSGVLVAEMDPSRKLLTSPYQTGDPILHPRHVSGSDMVMVTVGLGSLHAYFFHDCLWEEGWVGFGNRMKNVTFKSLANLKDLITLTSREVRVRTGESRVLIEFMFQFKQGNRLVYQSEQTAIFVKGKKNLMPC